MSEQNESFSLFELMRLAKSDQKMAAQGIKNFIESRFTLELERVEINQSEVSLNSVNGFLWTRGGTKLFFKFHAEEGETKTMDEMYNGKVLQKNGFPLVMPIYESTVAGEQFLIYPCIEVPTFFEVCREAENLKPGSEEMDLLLKAEDWLNRTCWARVQDTIRMERASVVSQQPLWQLFTHRLVSKEGSLPRIEQYYLGKIVHLPKGQQMNFEAFSRLAWTINGRVYTQTLEAIIQQAKELVNPSIREQWPVCVAHGDDHNGNKFYFRDDPNPLRYFDPAFAGEAVPLLLAFVKTTFHDTFAHPLWLYSPDEAEPDLKLEFDIQEGNILVNHNWDLENQSCLRTKILESKMKYLWKPLFATLREKGWLWDEALEFVKKALFCCPFLVYNLIDNKRYSPQMSLLALAFCVEMGSWAKEGSLLDNYLKDL